MWYRSHTNFMQSIHYVRPNNLLLCVESRKQSSIFSSKTFGIILMRTMRTINHHFNGLHAFASDWSGYCRCCCQMGKMIQFFIFGPYCFSNMGILIRFHKCSHISRALVRVDQIRFFHKNISRELQMLDSDSIQGHLESKNFERCHIFRIFWIWSLMLIPFFDGNFSID